MRYWLFFLVCLLVFVMASCDNGTKNDVPKNNKEQESNGKNITSEKMAREFFKEKDIELGLSKSYKSYCTIQSFKSEDVYSDDDKRSGWRSI